MVEGDNVIYIQRPGTLASLAKETTVTVNDKNIILAKVI